MAEALNHLQGEGTAGDIELARRMFAEVDNTSPVESREEPGKSYMKSVGVYFNLFARIATYSNADLVDEPLYFSQYDWLVSYLYFLLGPHVWETPAKHTPYPNVTKFATRSISACGARPR